MAVVCCAMNFDLDPDGCGSNLLTRTLNITSPRATGRNGSNCRTRMDALNYLARIGNNQHGFILRSSTVFCLIEIPCLSDNMCFRTWCPPYFSGYEFGCSSCRQSTQIRVESPCFFGQGHRWFVMFDHSKLVYPSEIQTWQLNISDR